MPATQVSSLAFPEVTVVVELLVVRASNSLERPLTATLHVSRPIPGYPNVKAWLFQHRQNEQFSHLRFAGRLSHYGGQR